MTPYYADDWLTVYQGDCREVMASMEPESVHCVVTSPPYWGLRDYGTATWIGGDEGCDHKGEPWRTAAKINTNTGGNDVKNAERRQFYRETCGKCGATRQDSQLGLEPTPEEYVANMVAVFREVRRVLRSDGTVWLNLGDSYANDGKWGGSSGGKHVAALHGDTGIGRGKRDTGLKPKDLVGIPWRVAFALQADGWYLRSDIIWSKPNPMPESVTDRPTKAHEYLFLLSKSARYYYDADAVREPDAGTDHPRRVLDGQPSLEPSGGVLGAHKGIRTLDGRNGSGRNLRSVWTVATQPYPGAHFATFPEKLIEPPIKAGTSERGVCAVCGKPWERVVVRSANPSKWSADEDGGRGFPKASEGHNVQSSKSMHRNGSDVQAPPPITTGWRPTCDHDSIPVPAAVLDPFAGSGTTGRVAQRLGRRAVLIDLNGDYLIQTMARNRDIPLGLESA